MARKHFGNRPLINKFSARQADILEARLSRLRDTGIDLGLVRTILITILPEALDTLPLDWLPSPELPPREDGIDQPPDPDPVSAGPLRLEIDPDDDTEYSNRRRRALTREEVQEDRHEFRVLLPIHEPPG